MSLQHTAWLAAVAPLRHLMTEAGTSLASPAGGSSARVEGAVAFIERLFATIMAI